MVGGTWAQLPRAGWAATMLLLLLLLRPAFEWRPTLQPRAVAPAPAGQGCADGKGLEIPSGAAPRCVCPAVDAAADGGRAGGVVARAAGEGEPQLPLPAAASPPGGLPPPAAAPDARGCTEDMLTVVLPTYKSGPFHPAVLWQFDALHEIICEIILVWDKPDAAAIQQLKNAVGSMRIPVQFDAPLDRAATLNNRFAPFAELRTTAVLQIDDDIFVRPQQVVAALKLFHRQPDQLISLTSCVNIRPAAEAMLRKVDHPDHPDAPSARDSYKQIWPLPRNESCDLALTNAAILHRKYHHLYWQESEVLAFVEEHHNCEDIAMNFVVEKELRRRHIAKVSRLGQTAGTAADAGGKRALGTNVLMVPPARQWISTGHLKAASPAGDSPKDPVLLAALKKRHKSGISKVGGHHKMRNRCVHEFERIFGGVSPLTRSGFATSWHPACFIGMKGHCHDHIYFSGCKTNFGKHKSCPEFLSRDRGWPVLFLLVRGYVVGIVEHLLQ